jgi:hypothetical protein
MMGYIKAGVTTSLFVGKNTYYGLEKSPSNRGIFSGHYIKNVFIVKLDLNICV